MKCSRLTKNEYCALQSDYFCITCISKNIPFSTLTDNDFYMTVVKCIKTPLNYTNNFNFLPSPSQQKLFNKLNNIINQNNFNNDDEVDDQPPINCNYYNVDEFVDAKFNASKSFSILHLNIHSIQFHIEDLRVMLQMLNFNFDIIAISESKLQVGVEPNVNINIEGFQEPISTPTEASKGGVLLYIANGINFKPRNDLKMYKSKELESAFIEIINPNEANSIVGVIYKHPCINGTIFNNDYLKPLLSKLSMQNNKRLFLSGDFNFNLIEASGDSDTADFFNCMTTNFLLPLITIPTKINTSRDTLIDNIFTNQFNPDFRTGNLTIGLSDHLPSFMIVPKTNQIHMPKKHNVYKRDTKRFNRENFLLDFFDINWDETIEINKKDVNNSFDNFMVKINEILDKHMPYKKISYKEFKNRYKPWINKEILDSIKEKNKLFKKYVNCKDNLRRSILFTEYKLRKNNVLQATRRNKKEFFLNYFNKNNKNLKKIWEGIKQIINIKSKQFNQPSCLTHGERTLTDPVQISNTFNDYFTSIADNLLNERKFNGNASFHDYLINPLSNSFVIYPCDEHEVKTLINQLEHSKSLGPNSIPTDILKLVQNEIWRPFKSNI